MSGSGVTTLIISNEEMEDENGRWKFLMPPHS